MDDHRCLQFFHEDDRKIPDYRKKKKKIVLRPTFAVITDSYHCVTHFIWAPIAIISTNKKMSLFSELHLIYHFCFSHPAHMVLCLNKSRLASFFIQTLWLTLIYIKELHQSYHPLNIHIFFMNQVQLLLKENLLSDWLVSSHYMQ